jgi:hypothetical protein
VVWVQPDQRLQDHKEKMVALKQQLLLEVVEDIQQQEQTDQEPQVVQVEQDCN